MRLCSIKNKSCEASLLLYTVFSDIAALDVAPQGALIE